MKLRKLITTFLFVLFIAGILSSVSEAAGNNSVSGVVNEEERTKAPTITLESDGDKTKFYLHNNDEEYSYIYSRLATSEQIESGEWEWYSGIGVQPSETTWGISLSSMIQSEASESGIYYIVAYAENENEARSELTVLEDYPIAVVVTSKNKTLEYHVGGLTGYGYFTEKLAPEYIYAEVQLGVTDKRGNTWTDTSDLNVRNGMFYLDTEYLNERYEEWFVEKIEFGKFEETKNGCMAVREIYTSVKEGEIYEEAKGEVPTITVEKNADGNITGIQVKNNNGYSMVYYGFLTRAQIESGDIGSFYSCEIKKGDFYALPLDRVNGIISGSVWFEGPGEYYFLAYTTPKEISILEEYPLVITEKNVDETLAYKVMEETEEVYFVNKAISGYTNADFKAQIVFEDGTINNEYNSCYLRNGLYCFETDWQNAKEWKIEEVTIGELTTTENAFLLNKNIYKSFVDEKDYEEPKPSVTETFTDVKPGEWYVEEIQYVFNKGMMSGVDGETFMPDEPVNRAMVVQTLYKNEGRPEVTDFTKYDVLKDINRDQWWANGVAWGMNHGIVKGYSDTMTFKPENSVTREDLATFLYRYARDVRKVDVTLSRSADAILGDAPVNSWAKDAFAWAIDKGLIKGITKTDSSGNTYYDLSPETGATRAQMATILMRFCEKYNI